MASLKDFVVRYNELAREERISTFSKGDLMKMAYGETYRNVDSALPMELLMQEGISRDEHWHYVMDYNNNGAFGKLTDLFDVIAKKNPTIEVYNDMYELTDTLPILDAVKKYENQDILWQIKRSDKSYKYAKGSTIKNKYEHNDFPIMFVEIPFGYGKKQGMLVTKLYNLLEKHNIEIDNSKEWHTKGFGEEYENEENHNIVKFNVNDAPNPKKLTEILWNLPDEEYYVSAIEDDKYSNGGGVAVSSESGLAVGTNADLLMNQNYLQYRNGGGVEDIQDKIDDLYVYVISETDLDELEERGITKSDLNNLSEEELKHKVLESYGWVVDEDDVNGEYYLRQRVLESHHNLFGYNGYPNDDYKNGGNMSSGFNYSIGGL